MTLPSLLDIQRGDMMQPRYLIPDTHCVLVIEGFTVSIERDGVIDRELTDTARGMLRNRRRDDIDAMFNLARWIQCFEWTRP